MFVCLCSYAALDARVLLSIAAVLDQQLRDGVTARNHLRRARTVSLAAAAERDAAAARAASLASINLPEGQDDDTGSVSSSSFGSSADSHGRRYSESSTGSDSDSNSSAQMMMPQVEEEHTTENMEQGRDENASQEDREVPIQAQLQHAAAKYIDSGKSKTAMPAPDRLPECEASAQGELTDEQRFGFLETVEAVRPGLHCYLPPGKDFVTS